MILPIQSQAVMQPLLSMQQLISAEAYRLNWFFHDVYCWNRRSGKEECDMHTKRWDFLRDYRHLCQITIELTTGERITKASIDWSFKHDEIFYSVDDDQTRYINPAYIVSYLVKEASETELEMVYKAASEQGLDYLPVPA